MTAPIAVPTNEARILATLPGADLALALKAVRVAVSKDETRPALCRIQVLTKPNTVILTATDGHRLHRVTISTDVGTDRGPGEEGALEPMDVDRLLFECKAAGKSGMVALHAARPADRFPDFEQVVPPLTSDARPFTHVNPGYLADACKGAAGLYSREIAPIRIQAGPDDCAPVRLDAEGHGTAFLAVLMPVRA